MVIVDPTMVGELPLNVRLGLLAFEAGHAGLGLSEEVNEPMLRVEELVSAMCGFEYRSMLSHIGMFENVHDPAMFEVMVLYQDAMIEVGAIAEQEGFDGVVSTSKFKSWAIEWSKDNFYRLPELFCVVDSGGVSNARCEWLLDHIKDNYDDPLAIPRGHKSNDIFKLWEGAYSLGKDTFNSDWKKLAAKGLIKSAHVTR